MAEIIVTSQNFEKEVQNSEKPILLDFWASWCGPCKMIAPIVSEIADEYSDSLRVGKVNVDEEEALATQFSIMSIPTLVLLEKGEVIEKVVGYRTKEDLEDTFLPLINN